MDDLTTIQETMALLDDWEDRYAYVIDLGRKLPDFPADYMIDEHLVEGCTSRVWMMLNRDEAGRLEIQATSDAHIVKGLIALVFAIYNGKTRDDIAALDINSIFDEMGLSDHLSPNRRSGFFAMVEKIKFF